MTGVRAKLKRLSFLICHPWMGFGGSEATTMWAIQALQETGAAVTFVTASEFDPKRYNRVYGTRVDPNSLVVRRAPRLPCLRTGSHFVHLQNGLFQRHCRSLAPAYDHCISGYNLVDFGKPGIQLIGDYTWSEPLRRSLDPDAERLSRHRDHLLRRVYLAVGDLIRGDADRPLADRGDLVLANSEWTREILQSEAVGLAECPVVFPPVIYRALEADSESPGTTTGIGPVRDPWSFVCLGRISPEKRIESIIAILGKVRAAGFPATLAIAGSADDPAYGREVRRLVDANAEWARLTGFLEAPARDHLLASSSFGIHARPSEAFGIAVAELAGSGCIPFVPDLGGPAEIVAETRLRFRDESEAVHKIIAVLGQPEIHAELRRNLADSVARFRPERFMEAFLIQVERFVGDSPVRHAKAPAACFGGV